MTFYASSSRRRQSPIVFRNPFSSNHSTIIAPSYEDYFSSLATAFSSPLVEDDDEDTFDTEPAGDITNSGTSNSKEDMYMSNSDTGAEADDEESDTDNEGTLSYPDFMHSEQPVHYSDHMNTVSTNVHPIFRRSPSPFPFSRTNSKAHRVAKPYDRPVRSAPPSPYSFYPSTPLPQLTFPSFQRTEYDPGFDSPALSSISLSPPQSTSEAYTFDITDLPSVRKLFPQYFFATEPEVQTRGRILRESPRESKGAILVSHGDIEDDDLPEGADEESMDEDQRGRPAVLLWHGDIDEDEFPETELQSPLEGLGGLESFQFPSDYYQPKESWEENEYDVEEEVQSPGIWRRPSTPVSPVRPKTPMDDEHVLYQPKVHYGYYTTKIESGIPWNEEDEMDIADVDQDDSEYVGLDYYPAAMTGRSQSTEYCPCHSKAFVNQGQWQWVGC